MPNRRGEVEDLDLRHPWEAANQENAGSWVQRQLQTLHTIYHNSFTASTLYFFPMTQSSKILGSRAVVLNRGSVHIANADGARCNPEKHGPCSMKTLTR